MSLTISKLNTKRARNCNNHAVKVDGHLVAIVGLPHITASHYVVFPNHSSMDWLEDETFGSINEARLFFRKLVAQSQITDPMACA